MTKSRPRGAAYAMAGLGIALAVSLRAFVPSRDPASARMHRQTARLLARTAALARLVAPGRQANTFEVQAPAVNSLHGTWTVVSEEPDGSEPICAVWSASTGELMSVSQVIRPDVGRPIVSDRGTAVQICWRWARVLSMADGLRAWRTERVIHRRQDEWVCVYRSGSRRIFVQITRAGDLVFALASRSVIQASQTPRGSGPA